MNRTRFSIAAAAVLSLCFTSMAGGLPSATAAGSDDVATGFVYEDRNGNGTRDEGERGIAGVPVSNGLDVVTTDKSGAYSLPVDDETIIFISKPAEWDVPVNEVQLPQFYYLHYPNGTPHELKYGGIDPTGPLPESVDFALVKQDGKGRRGQGGKKGGPNKFDAIFFADPQTKTLEQVEDMRKDVVEELKGTDAEFGLTVGDVVNDPLDLFPAHNEAVAEIGIPWWNLPGNHDMDYDAPTDEHATDTYKSVFGPTNYSFNYGKVHVIALDNIEHKGTGNGYRGLLTDEQLAWIEADLAQVKKDKLIVIATHIPLKNDATTSPGNNTANLDKLLELLEGRRVWSVAGHDTSNSWQMYLGEEDGWFGKEPFHHQILAEVRGAGWNKGPIDERGVHAADMADGNPNGYYTMSFKGSEYTPQYKPASLPADFLMRHSFDGGADNTVYVPGGPSGSGDFASPVTFNQSDWNAEKVPTLTTNVFEGGSQHTVEVSIDGERYEPMTHSEPVLDPYATWLYETYKGTEEAPGKPEPSSHIWTASLPEGLAVGSHTVTVRATDPYGQVSTRTATFEVVAG